MCIMRMCVVVMLVKFEGKLVINVVLCDYRLWKSIHYCFIEIYLVNEEIRVRFSGG